MSTDDEMGVDHPIFTEEDAQRILEMMMSMEYPAKTEEELEQEREQHRQWYKGIQLAAQRSETERLLDENTRLKQRVDELQQELFSKTEESAGWKAKFEEAHRREQQIDQQAKAQQRTLEQENQALRDENERLRKRIADLEAKVDELSGLWEGQVERSNELEEQIDNLRKELARKDKQHVDGMSELRNSHAQDIKSLRDEMARRDMERQASIKIRSLIVRTFDTAAKSIGVNPSTRTLRRSKVPYWNTYAEERVSNKDLENRFEEALQKHGITEADLDNLVERKDSLNGDMHIEAQSPKEYVEVLRNLPQDLQQFIHLFAKCIQYCYPDFKSKK
eukprot:m.211735 g.211735  ORF g.211735 m.211735 type:complete len:334 (-) comp18802_c0_seq1:204-1205(-)